jgi:MOSC domain-containing protein YiiM
MVEAPEVVAVAGKGLEGDASYGRRTRQILMMEAETLDRFSLAPGSTRENLLMRGVRLAGLPPGARIRVGESVVLEVSGDCTPCDFMDQLRPGLQEEIRGERGMLARVVRGGAIRPGDAVDVEAGAATTARA